MEQIRYYLRAASGARVDIDWDLLFQFGSTVWRNISVPNLSVARKPTAT